MGYEKRQDIMTGWSGTSALLKPWDKIWLPVFSSYCHFQWWTQCLYSICDPVQAKHVQTSGHPMVQKFSFWPLRPMFWYEKRRVSPLLYCFAQNTKTLHFHQPHIPFIISPTASWVRAQSLRSCSILCNPTDCSSPGSSVHGILQARIVKWVPCPSPGDLSNPGIEPGPPAVQADSLLLSHQGSPHCHLPPH